MKYIKLFYNYNFEDQYNHLFDLQLIFFCQFYKLFLLKTYLYFASLKNSNDRNIHFNTFFLIFIILLIEIHVDPTTSKMNFT